MSKTLEQMELRTDKLLNQLQEDGFTAGEIFVIGQIIAHKADISMHVNQLHKIRLRKPLIHRPGQGPISP